MAFPGSMELLLLCASNSFNVHDLQQVVTARDSTCSEKDSRRDGRCLRRFRIQNPCSSA